MTRFSHIYRVLSLLAAILLPMLVSGCSEDLEMSDGPQPDSINVTVTVPAVPGTRADNDNLNEFKVRSLHLYFFATEGYDEASSVYLFDYEVPGEFNISRSLRINLPEDALKSGGLFGLTSNECRVYAVANVDETLLVSESVAGLKATVVGSNFEKTAIQDSFAMDGEAMLNLDRSTRTVTGSIELHRAAAKLTLAVDLPQKVTATETIINPNDGTKTEVDVEYTPHADQMHVWLSNGVKESELNTAPHPSPGERLYSNEITAVENVGSTLTFDDNQPKYKYVQTIPFYSYPGKWDLYASSGNSRLTLMIPWSYNDKQGTQHTIVTYYSLSVNPDGNEIVRNRHYDMRVSINRIGGSSVQTPVDMLFDWNYVIEWNRQTLPTDIKEIRYLLLNNNDYNSAIQFTGSEIGAYAFEMTNSTYIEIPFSSSHPIEIASVQLKWRDYFNNADRTLDLGLESSDKVYKYSETVVGYKEDTQYAGIEIDQANQVLKVKRSILHIAWENNTPAIKTDQDAISAYTFYIKLRHTDDVNTDANICITQLPAIYITSEETMSADHRYVNNNNASYTVENGEEQWQNVGPYPWNFGWVWVVTSTDYYGYVAATNVPSDDIQKKYFLGSVNDLPQNGNGHTYIITISKFNDGDYIIGDPRTRTVDNLPIINSAANNSPDWTAEDVNKRHLQYYYPTDDNPDKERFIAPQIRIASQWGITHQVIRDGALRRCASYQENGRPAGRWRLPTIAEIEYLARLSNKKFIPYLFGSAGTIANYWCASGGVDVNNGHEGSEPEVNISTDQTTKRYVRCVYDEWYWGDDVLPDKSKFTWGDRLRSVNGNN